MPAPSAISATTPTPSLTSGGRAAAIARRTAMSAGKSALPAAKERVRNGERSAAVPSAVVTGTSTATPTAASSGAREQPVAAHPAKLGYPVATSPSLSGRLLSIERRRLLANGKQALRTMPGAQPALPSTTGHASPVARPVAADCDCPGDSCHQQARARRAIMSVQGRGTAPAAAPSRAPRQGRLQYAPKVVESVTQARQTVTGLRIGRGSQVTGVEAGASLPVSGTQYIGADGGAAMRGAVQKVGFARTVQGSVVSGSLVRSSVSITGDEAGSTVTITGEAEQRTDDDLTPRSGDRAHVSAQFQRQVDPHGHSVFGTNLGRTARHIGSRERSRETPLESTEAGLAITGSAVGRSTRVTGDEEGACRQVTGDQYLSPARAEAECGGTGGGTAPLGRFAGVRRDPVTGQKVSVAATWGQQRITGPNVEHNPAVTGDAPGSCALITGTPYQGPKTIQGWCDPEIAEAAEQRLSPRAAASAVTGNTPMSDERVTGTARGATRSVTGTPYYRADAAAVAAADPVAALDERFSVHSPQRAAHLRAERAAAEKPDAASRITGSFAVGGKNITGNLEFTFKPRLARDTDAKPAHTRLTGEGRTTGTRISGFDWADRKNVTGTEGFTAVLRNASERDGKPQAFAGAARLRSPTVKEDQKQLVTGMFGWSSSTSAKVTLSGGAQG